MRNAFVVTDTLTALEECGDLRIPIENGTLDAASVVPLDRLVRDGAIQHPAGPTVFKSVGVALADLAAAQWIFNCPALAQPAPKA